MSFFFHLYKGNPKRHGWDVLVTAQKNTLYYIINQLVCMESSLNMRCYQRTSVLRTLNICGQCWQFLIFKRVFFGLMKFITLFLSIIFCRYIITQCINVNEIGKWKMKKMVDRKPINLGHSINTNKIRKLPFLPWWKKH